MIIWIHNTKLICFSKVPDVYDDLSEEVKKLITSEDFHNILKVVQGEMEKVVSLRIFFFLILSFFLFFLSFLFSFKFQTFFFFLSFFLTFFLSSFLSLPLSFFLLSFSVKFQTFFPSFFKDFFAFLLIWLLSLFIIHRKKLIEKLISSILF